MAMTAAPGLANKANGPAASNGLSKGNPSVQHLELYQKDATWDAVAGGAWGRMNINSDTFVFNGHDLVSGDAYSLYVYDQVSPDAWNGDGPVLGTATADAGGNVHIAGTFSAEGLAPGDLQQAKIWLVLADDVDAGSGDMTAWNPTRYLFEHNVITLP